MTKQEKADAIRIQLDALFPNPSIPLFHTNTYTLCVAVLLSAHTTDKSVNAVTPALFKIADNPAAMERLGIEKIHGMIRTVGLAKTKSHHLWNMSRLLSERHGGDLPSTLEELEALPGVGHKTASVVMCQAFGQPAFPVDTHIHRLAERWGLSNGTNVVRTESDLKKVFHPSSWAKLHLQMIYYGREYCPARGHDLGKCLICSEFGSGKPRLGAKSGLRRKK